MLEISKDSSIHKDGIYDIDESCYIKTNSSSKEDNIIFALLALFVFYK
ncbi:MAG: hypothetical protein Q4D26_08580 [Clostridia bacterium]|nr:hypothetical protein [Clostridia bacterium]